MARINSEFDKEKINTRHESTFYHIFNGKYEVSRKLAKDLEFITGIDYKRFMHQAKNETCVWDLTNEILNNKR